MIARVAESTVTTRLLIGLVALGGGACTAAMALRLPAALLVLLPVALVAGLAVASRPWIAGLFLILSVPAQQEGALGGGSLTATRACLGVSVAAVAVWWTVFRRPVVLHRGIVLFGALIGALLLSAQVATDQTASESDIARWLFAFVAFVAFLQFFGDGVESKALWFAAAVVAAAAVEAAYGVAQSLRGVGPASFAVGNATRAFGTFGRPNSFAGFLEFGPFLGLSLALWFAALARSDLERYRVARLQGMARSAAARRDLMVNGIIAGFFLGGAATAMVGILASFSRGAWLGIAVAAPVFATLLGPRSRRFVFLVAPIAAGIVIAGLANQLPAALDQRLGSITDTIKPFNAAEAPITDANFSTVERMAHWQAGWHMFEDHPVLGVGAGNFNTRYPDYFVREEFRISAGHAHNFYIHMLAENGLIGLLVYLTLIGFFVLLALSVVLGCPGGLPRALALGCLATLVSVSVHNFFENLHVLNVSIMFAALWVLTIAAHRMWRRTGTNASVWQRHDVEYSGV